MRRLLVIALLLTSSTFAQDPETVELPDAVMRQVIGRIAQYKFKPTRRPRTIPVAKPHVKAEWLPTISNVTFKLVPDDEIYDYAKGVFLVEDPTREGTTYSINVGWGDLECDASGETWKFTIRGESVRLWPTQEGWGRGCGGNAAPTVRGLKIGDVSPNELPGYEFFKRGKLKNIRLGISTREDMKKLFGDDCEGPCDYDDKWEIWVNYFRTDSRGTGTSDSPEGKIETKLVPKSHILDTLMFVRLFPKRTISFRGVAFPRAFNRGQSYSIGDDWDADGFAGAVHSTIDNYTDGYGLTYEIYNEETFNNLKHKDQNRKPPKKGDLVGIEYTIPDTLDNKVYDKTTRLIVKK